ncbi:MAG: hypothetical protein ABW185_28895, partial [Sedimenticola sp.]
MIRCGSEFQNQTKEENTESSEIFDPNTEDDSQEVENIHHQENEHQEEVQPEIPQIEVAASGHNEDHHDNGTSVSQVKMTANIPKVNDKIRLLPRGSDTWKTALG